jgi:MFS transporter, DHA1 family, tetracycline resistance protein
MTGRNSILVIVFLDLLGAGLVMPMLPYITQSFGASLLLIGVFGALFPIFQAAASPLWGTLADRFGKRPAILTSVFGNLLASLLFVYCAYEQSLLLLLFSRALSGAMSGSLVTAKAYLADLSETDELSQNMGLFGAAQALGFACGPALGALSSVDGFRLPAIIAATIAAFALLLSLFVLPESRKETSAVSAEPFGFKNLRERYLWIYILQLFFITYSISHLFLTFPIFIQQTFGFGPRENGLFFALIAIIAIVIQGFVFGKLVKNWSEPRLFIAGGISVAAAFLLFPIASQVWQVAIFSGIAAAGFSLCQPAILSLIQSRANSANQGRLSGYSEAIAAIARMMGPISSGILMQYGGTKVSFTWAAGFALLSVLIFKKNLRSS